MLESLGPLTVPAADRQRTTLCFLDLNLSASPDAFPLLPPEWHRCGQAPASPRQSLFNTHEESKTHRGVQTQYMTRDIKVQITHNHSYFEEFVCVLKICKMHFCRQIQYCHFCFIATCFLPLFSILWYQGTRFMKTFTELCPCQSRNASETVFRQ